MVRRISALMRGKGLAPEETLRSWMERPPTGCVTGGVLHNPSVLVITVVTIN